MSMGGGAARREQQKAMGRARVQEQQGNEDNARSRQRAERGSSGRGRNMMEGRLSEVMPSSLKQTLG